MGYPRTDLKDSLYLARIPFKEAAARVGVNYTTFVNYLNGFSSFPPQIESRVLKLIAEKQEENRGLMLNRGPLQGLDKNHLYGLTR